MAVLDDCLRDHVRSTFPLREALAAYQHRREAETKAVVRLCRFAAPFQYGQPSRIMKLRKVLWLLNIALRSMLHKVSLGVLPYPGIMAMMDPELPFATIMRRSDQLTVALWSLFFLVVAKLGSRLLGV